MIQGSIARDLDAYEGTQWFTSGYLITMSSLAPLMGKFAAIFTPRSLVLPISLLVSTGAIISAFAATFEGFVLGRVVMGMGGAGVLTLAVILVLDLTGKKRRGFVMGCVNAGFSIGVSMGGIVYGALLPAVGWRAMFWIQCPVALVSGLCLFLSLQPPPDSAKFDNSSTWTKLRRIDYLGAALLVSTIVLFLYGLAGKIQLIPILLSPVCLLLFILVEMFFAFDPVIPLKVLKSRAALLSCVSQLGLMSARWTVLFYMPIFTLAVLGEPRAKAGAVLVPTNVGFALGGIIVGALHIKRNGSFWLPCLVSIFLFSLSMFLLSFVASPDVHLAALIVAVITGGIATGAALNYTLAHILHHSHEGTQYITTSLLGTFRGFGGAFGTSIGGGVFQRLLQTSLTTGFLSIEKGEALSPERKRLVSQLLGAPEMVFGGGLSDAEREVAVDAYAGASKGVWQAAAVLGLVVLVLQAGTGWNGPDKEEKVDEAEARANTMEAEGVPET